MITKEQTKDFIARAYDIAVKHGFHEKMLTYPDLQFAVCGHQHTTIELEPYGDGFKYYQCGAAKGRKYLIFTLKKDGGYHREVIDY